MKFYFPLHLDGDNRGCEAIAKGTAMLLNVPKENLIGLCTIYYFINDLLNLVSFTTTVLNQ